MKLQRHGIMAGLALTATLALAACGSDNNTTPSGSGGASAGAGASGGTGSISCATGSLTAQGSTAQANAMNQWIKAYQTACSGANITYQGTGSGAGQTAFISGTADFAGSDSPFAAADQPKADKRCGTGPAVHLPMVVGPIAIAYNLTGVTDLQLKPATLAQIFAGKITKWSDPAIKADNTSATLPDTPILAVHRSDSSGTTDNFTKYLAAAAKTDWTYAHDKVWKAPGGSAQKGSDGVGGAVTKTQGAIGYVEWSYAQVNNLATAKIQNGAGEFTALTGDAAGKTIAGATVAGTGDDLKLNIDYNTTASGAYPIVLVSYEIACDKGNKADKVALLKSFLTYTSSAAAQSSVTSIGYAPLPDSVRTKVASVVSNLG
ncbi:MAG TPA: phosphate ABC transporter substrate-binding protein PstS [Rugosimonospora sp.]|nr:phosphate ABC transporter substrate-binding protein PstS [Rugosimonospora sp.]